MYSTDKAGTTVSVDRPRSERAEEQAAAGPAAPALGPEERATVPAGTPIPVVEDDPPVRRLTVGALEGLGYTDLVCAGGSEALEIGKASRRERVGKYGNSSVVAVLNNKKQSTNY